MNRTRLLTAVMMSTLACGGAASDGTKVPDSRDIPSEAAGLAEGKDYIVLERVRILDEQGFDQPVEAMSVLVPKGWHTESGVRWGSVGGCRGDIVTWSMRTVSPDGAIEFAVLPTRTFVASQSRMMHQSLMAAQQAGGCVVNPPFTASQYLEGLAKRDLQASSVSDIKEDVAHRALIDKLSEQSNAIAQQYGNNTRQSGSVVFGTATWPDGKKGLLNVGVSVIENPGVDMYGAPNGFATTNVFYNVYIKYPPEREAEALRYFGTITTSHRMNPIWSKAKEQFLTQLGNVEHAGRMERLRLMGEQAKAYAKAASEASDAQMRDWEKRQASSDANQARFIQTIREVETWKDADGTPVELNAGYDYGWSRPDGTILLTNVSTFDPAVALQQDWKQMKKIKD